MERLARVIVWSFFALATCYAWPANAGPSFECRKADTPATIAICGNDQLGQMDQTMADTYALVSKAVTLAGGKAAAKVLRDSQRQWIRQRDDCGGDTKCLAASLQSRIAALSALLGETSTNSSSTSPPNSGPSFDCGKATTPAMIAICSSERLGQMDRAMAATYSAVFKAASLAGGKAATNVLRDSQRRWIRKRDQCGSDTNCLAASLQSRTAALSDLLGQSPATAQSDQVAGTCEERLSLARDYASALKVTVSLFEDGAQDSVPAKGDVATFATLEWRAPDGTRPALPTFLIIDAQPEARFRGVGFVNGKRAGAGFLALTASAKGLMGIRNGEGRTRAFFPLHRDISSTARDGLHQISIYPGRPGVETTGWAVVTGGECGEHALAEGRSQEYLVPIKTLSVATQNPYEADSPLKRVYDSTGRYELFVFDGRYEVREKRGGTLVTAREGDNPTFSPTGRFVAHYRARDYNLVIVDLIEDKEVRTLAGGQLVWVRQDSYVLHAAYYGIFGHFQTLLDGDPEGGVATIDGCHACNPWDGEVTLDLDRGFVAIIGTDDSVRTADLATDRWQQVVVPPGLGQGQRTPNEKADEALLASFRASADAALRADYGPEARVSSKHWSVGEPLLVTHSGDEPDSSLAAGTVRPVDPFGRETASNGGASRNPLTGVTLASRGLAFTGDQVARGAAPLARPSTASVPKEEVFRRIEAVIGLLRPAIAVERYQRPDPWQNPSVAPNPQLESLVDTFRREVPEIAPKFGKGDLPCTEWINGSPDSHLGGTIVATVWSWPSPGHRSHVIQTECTQGSLGVNYGELWLLRKPDHDHGRALDLLAILAKEGQAEGDSALGFLSNSAQRVRAVPADGDLLLLASPAGNVGAVVDLATGTRLGRLFGLGDGNLIVDMRITDDLKHVVLLYSDDRFRVVSIDAKVDRAFAPPPDLLGAHVDDEIVVMTQDGRFDATYEGAQAVQMRIPGFDSLPTIHQFASKLRRPGLAAKVLGISSQAESEEFAIAGRLDPFGASGYILPPPVAELKIGDQSANGRRTGTISYSSSRLDNVVRLFVDGREVRKMSASGRQGTVPFELDDPGGGRWLTALAVDADGVTSLPSSVQLPEKARPRGSLRAVLVGINRYTGDSSIPSLGFAAADANRLGKALEASKGHASVGVQTEIITDEAATKDAILGAVRQAASLSGPEDTLLISFAGHGLSAETSTDARSELVLGLSGTRLDDLASTALPWSELVDAISATQGTVVFVLDVCHAGLAGSEAFATNDDAAGALLTAAGKPVIVLAGSKGRQFSLEAAEDNGGVFTSALVSAIAEDRERADGDGNGIVDLGELYSAVRGDVMKKTGNSQTPWLARNALVGEMALF